MMTEAASVAYVFPGQASQDVGMGLEFYNKYEVARRVFDLVDTVLGFSISDLCFNGPEEELVKTVNVQPAIVACSIACYEVARNHKINFPPPSFLAGHSLGEYTALIVAESLDYEDALRLVRERGRLMYEAGLRYPGGMLAIIATEISTVEELCTMSGCNISNINCPGQIVVSGSDEALEKAKTLAKEQHIRRVIPLKVSGAFHSYLMQPILDEFRQLIGNTSFRKPVYPVISNVTARPLIDADSIKDELVKQLRYCIQWQSSIEYLNSCGVTEYYEIGLGTVLSGLIKRIDQNAVLHNISTSEDL